MMWLSKFKCFFFIFYVCSKCYIKHNFEKVVSISIRIISHKTFFLWILTEFGAWYRPNFKFWAPLCNWVWLPCVRQEDTGYGKDHKGGLWMQWGRTGVWGEEKDDGIGSDWRRYLLRQEQPKEKRFTGKE